MKRPHVYLHVAGMYCYREIVAEIFGAIEGSGLYGESARLTAVLSAEADVTFLHGEKWRVIRTSYGVDHFEFPTLQVLRADAIHLPGDTPVLYLHSKGASATNIRKRRHKGQWRRYMLHWMVQHWRECVAMLGSSECVGTDWLDSVVCDWRHYGGNFWWARADYLAKLPVPMATLKVPYSKSPRYIAEMWIGAGHPLNPAQIHAVGSYIHRSHVNLPEAGMRSDYRPPNEYGVFEDNQSAS